MPTLPRPTYGSTVTPRNPVNMSRLSEELIPVRFRRVNPAASLKPEDELVDAVTRGVVSAG